MPLHRVIYVSDAVGAAGSNLLSFVEILGVSDRNNRRDHLTGALLCHGGRFLQVIEGARGDLDMLMNRLRADPRHQNIRILSDEPVASRRFDAWAMAQADVTPEIVALIPDATLGALSASRAATLMNAIVSRLPQPA
ncbi:MAG: BLUF domain-containing protein [Brevundimonas sp.]|nr:MAG: BLUF domain-containing protein [Brevundimonas sp.]